MSAPAPDWMAAVMRGCRSLALMVSSTHLGAQRLAGLGHLALQLDVGLGDEVDPAHPVQLGALGEGGRAARGQDALDAARHAGAATPAVLTKARRFIPVGMWVGLFESGARIFLVLLDWSLTRSAGFWADLTSPGTSTPSCLTRPSGGTS